MKFVDQAKIYTASGKGGPGSVSFRREAKVPRGGPDGGDGGKGGDVLIRADKSLHSLLDFTHKKNFRAENGQPGAGQNRSGRAGNDALILVPPGTLVKNVETDQILADIGEGDEVLLLEGGLGGKGNTHFKTSVNQAPQKAQSGLPGESMEILLELKLIADVGLIGLPNAGKSTLISVISAARPKIADYPFTTLVPNLGVVAYGDFQSFVVADIPGLIPGAHKGEGLGSQFLRHIERTSLFLHLIDISELATREPMEAYEEIQEELKLHDQNKQQESGYSPLVKRKQFVVLTKIDTLDEDAIANILEQFEARGLKVLPVSAVTNRGIKELVNSLGQEIFNGEVDV